MDVTGVMSTTTTPPGPRVTDAGHEDTATRSAVALARAVWSGTSYAARTVGAPGGLRGLIVEMAWTAVHLSLYPWGLLDEALRLDGVHVHHRTDSLPPGQRSFIVRDIDAATTPVLLVHGIIDNRSIFAVLARALRRRGHGTVQAVNYSPVSALVRDVRDAARDLGEHVERLCAATGADRVHIVGHSLGGLIARYYVQRLDGDARVDTLVTLGTPHRGSVIAHLMPPATVPRQLRPGSDLLTELEEPAPGCRTHMVAVWSRMDEMIIPQSSARLEHPDLTITQIPVDHVGHLAMTVDPGIVHAVTRLLAGHERPTLQACPA